jgi:phosphatidylserine decarboxylase
MPTIHQFIERDSGRVCTEPLFADRLVRMLYHPVRENAELLFRALTGPRASKALAWLNYDLALGSRVLGNRGFLQECGVDFTECLDPPRQLDTARKVFERKIRYWDCRPMPEHATVVSPADARVLVGSFAETSLLFIKEKFFSFEEILGPDRPVWRQAFAGGDFAIFRLTPDKYHYNHVPVSGVVIDFYEVDGCYNACNPAAVVAMATPYSKNRRVVTIIDTNVPGGSGIGLVAMIEVVALMIGEVVQCYSETRYDRPVSVEPGLFLRRGQPKSLYRPGSSTDVLIFQSGRIRFDPAILQNLHRRDVQSRFSTGFSLPLVETDVKVRSLLA